MNGVLGNQFANAEKLAKYWRKKLKKHYFLIVLDFKE